VTQPVAVIPHPNHPSVTVTARKLDRTEKWEIEEELAADRRPIVITDHEGLPMIDPRTRQPFFAWDEKHARSSLKSAMARPKRSITGWSGITDGKKVGEGAAIAFSADKIRTLWADEKYDVTLDHCLICDQGASDAMHTLPALGEDVDPRFHGFLDSVPFGAYLNKVISEEKVFDSDPQATGSA
jgi:hypothetical protein